MKKLRLILQANTEVKGTLFDVHSLRNDSGVEAQIDKQELSKDLNALSSVLKPLNIKISLEAHGLVENLKHLQSILNISRSKLIA